MKKQKFKRGNVVEILIGCPSSINGKSFDMEPEMVGRKAVICGSYSDIHSGDDIDNYAIVFMDDGSFLAWKRENQLKLIEKGSEALLEKAKKIGDKIKKQQRDLSYILPLLNEGDLSSGSILFLFDMIGYQSAFNRTGEPWHLWREWDVLRPVFIHIKDSNSIEEARSAITEEGLKDFNVDKVFNEFQCMKVFDK